MSRHPEFVSTDERASSIGAHDSDSKPQVANNETLLISNCTKSKSVIWQYVPPKEGTCTVKRTSQEIAYMKTHCSKQPATALKSRCVVAAAQQCKELREAKKVL